MSTSFPTSFQRKPTGFRDRFGAALAVMATDARWVPAGFAGLSLLGTLLLKLPAALKPGATLSWLDALFVSVSAVCVTGLSPVTISDTFSPYGQAILVALIQAGGIGISTAATLLVLLGGRRLSLTSELQIQASIGRIREARPVDIFAYSVAAIFICELAGVLALFHLLQNAQPTEAPLVTLWDAVFHSISAFCNAGFSTWPEGMARWRDHPGILALINLLVITGGIGLLTLVNLRYWYFWRRDPRRRGRLTLQSRLSVLSAAVLLAASTLVIVLFEWDHSLQDAGVGAKFSWAWFHATNCRTSGFNVVDLDAMRASTLLFSMLLMFIGGAPGSMAGGIKTLTVALLVLAAWNALRRRGDIQMLRRRIPGRQVSLAVLVTLIAGAAVFAGILSVLATEEFTAAGGTGHRWLAVAFEAVSAFGTVGLSTGITPLLSDAGKAIIILLMFAGRVGPLVLTLMLSRPVNPWRIRYPEEEVCLG